MAPSPGNNSPKKSSLTKFVLKRLTHDAPALPTSPVIVSTATIEKVSWELEFMQIIKLKRRVRKFFIQYKFIRFK